MAMDSACRLIFSFVNFAVNVSSGDLESTFRTTAYHCFFDRIKGGGVLSLTSGV